MRIILDIAVCILCLLMAIAFCLACPKGSESWKDGVCVVDIQPEYAPAPESHWISDEKPPRDKMPSYERPGIKVIDVPNLTVEQADEMAQEKQADFVGKKNAGILKEKP